MRWLQLSSLTPINCGAVKNQAAELLATFMRIMLSGARGRADLSHLGHLCGPKMPIANWLGASAGSCAQPWGAREMAGVVFW